MTTVRLLTDEQASPQTRDVFDDKAQFVGEQARAVLAEIGVARDETRMDGADVLEHRLGQAAVRNDVAVAAVLFELRFGQHPGPVCLASAH